MVSDMDKTRDPVNQAIIEHRNKYGTQRLGIANNYTWTNDPRHLLFSMARYKFVAKMLSGSGRVVEIGCGDAFCSPIVRQEVGYLKVTDFDPLLIADAVDRSSEQWPIDAEVHDILEKPLVGEFDAAYSMDVLEHIPTEQDDVFVNHIKAVLPQNGVLICGMPSIESQVFASVGSKKGHINCKTGKDFKQLMERHFGNVFLFSMNDEVVHTGFEKMAHYLMCLCAGPIK